MITLYELNRQTNSCTIDQFCHLSYISVLICIEKAFSCIYFCEHFCPFCFCLEFPPPIIDNGKNFSGDELKKKQDEAALIVKTCYW